MQVLIFYIFKARWPIDPILDPKSISIDDIEKEPNLSWYIRDYLKDEYIESLCSQMTNFEWVEFGKLFTLEKGKLQSSKVDEVDDDEETENNNEKGDILFITKAEINNNI